MGLRSSLTPFAEPLFWTAQSLTTSSLTNAGALAVVRVSKKKLQVRDLFLLSEVSMDGRSTAGRTGEPWEGEEGAAAGLGRNPA